MGKFDAIDTAAMPMTAPQEHADFLGRAASSARLRVASGIAILVVVVLMARSIEVQVLRGRAFASEAAANRTRVALVTPTRGVIVDRRGHVLVGNATRYGIGIVPADLPRGADGDAVLAIVADVLGHDLVDLRTTIAAYPVHLTEPILIAEDLAFGDASARFARLADIPAAQLIAEHTRVYGEIGAPIPESMGHLLGYLGRMDADAYRARAGERYRPTDRVGKNGIEASYERTLRGTPGARTLIIDVAGRVASVTAAESAVAGAELPLTVNLDLQRSAERVLRSGARAVGVRAAAAVVLDPASGEVLAMVSIPTYDASAFARGLSHDAYAALVDDPAKPLFPRAYAGTYPSGSTIKPLIAAAALSRGVISERTRLLSTGGIAVEQSWFPDWRAGGHGWVSVREALAQSVNTFFYLIGGGKPRAAPASMAGPTQEEALGPDRIAAALRAFGLGAATGLDISGEAGGRVPDPAWKEEALGEEWYIGDTYHLAIGQGDVLVTPLQMAAVTAAFANGGYAVTPHLVVGNASTSIPGPERIAGITSEAVEAVRRGLRAGVTEGSAIGLAGLPVVAYGKTGTAEHQPGKPPHAWFVGFAERARGDCAGVGDRTSSAALPSCIALSVLVEHGGEGSRVAVPIARDILAAWYAQLVSPPAS